MTLTTKDARAAQGASVVLLTLCASQFLMALDSSVMNVSIATVADDLNTTVTGIQTAIVLYTLVIPGSVLIASLTASFLTGIADNPDVPAEVTSKATVELSAGIPFISDADLQTAMEEAGATPEVTQAVIDVNEQARLDGLRSALALLAIIAVIALFFTKGIPQVQPGAAPTLERSTSDDP